MISVRTSMAQPIPERATPRSRHPSFSSSRCGGDCMVTRQTVKTCWTPPGPAGRGLDPGLASDRPGAVARRAPPTALARGEKPGRGAPLRREPQPGRKCKTRGRRRCDGGRCLRPGLRPVGADPSRLGWFAPRTAARPNPDASNLTYRVIVALLGSPSGHLNRSGSAFHHAIGYLPCGIPIVWVKPAFHHVVS